MADVKDVIKAVELCIRKEQCIMQYPEEHCPYEKLQGSYEDWCDECTSRLAEDVLKLLKKDKPRNVIKIVRLKNVTGYCPACDVPLYQEHSPRWCGHCGQALNWGE